MVIDVAINWVSNDQVEQIKKGSKTALVRMEDESLWRDYEDWKQGKELYIRIGQWEAFKGWLIVDYMDYFKLKELETQTECIQKCGFSSKLEMKKYLDKLYGIELEEDPYILYIEFKLVLYPKLTS